MHAFVSPRAVAPSVLRSPGPRRSAPGACLFHLGLVTALALGVAPGPVEAASGMPDLVEPARTGLRAADDAAVVIGVEDYAYLPDVPYARGDAQAFDDFVRYTRGIPDDRVALLRDARAYEIERAVKDAGARVGPGGRVWVYFAGHGAMDPNGSRRLLLGGDAATDPEAFARFAVAVDDVRAWATAGGGEAVLVVDACYNGGGRTGEGVLTGGRRVAVPEYALTATKAAAEWAATGPKELSAPLPAVGHGAFTYFAVGALRGWADGEVDGKRDGSVTGEEANRYVARALRTVQAGGQTPQLAADDAAKLVLARGVKEAGPGADALRALRDAAGAGGAKPPPREQAPDPVEIVEAGAWSAADEGVLEAMVEAETSKLAAATRARAEQALSTRAAARVKEVAAEWAALSGAFGAPEAASAEAVAAVDAKVAEWRADAVRVAAQDAPLGGSVSYKGRTRALSATVRVEEVRVAVDHGATIARADAWLAAAKVSSKAAAKGSSGRDWQSPTLGAMRWIPAGSFTMGSPASEAGRDDDEVQHRVTLTKGFWLMEHEVTQGEWEAVMGSNPSRYSACGPTCPVEQVSWDDAVEFAKRASARDGVTYRLPTEAEWEYAARGGQSHVYAGGDEATAVGWIRDNSGGQTHPVCEKGRNGYGLYDMSGNVFEWVSDGYGDYPGGSVTDPTGASAGLSRVFRGGGWDDLARSARVANRDRHDPTVRFGGLGFRLARTSP